MLGLTVIRDWIEEMQLADHHYIGKLDAKQDRSIGVYQRNVYSEPRVAIGGRELASYDVKYISVLVHWNEDAWETEKAAFRLFEQLKAARDVIRTEEVTEEDQTTTATHRILFIDMQVPEPVDVGTDDNGIYERVIWADVYYEREE